MDNWHSQHYKKYGKELGVEDDILDNAVKSRLKIKAVDSRLPSIFTLRHLAYIANVDFSFLRKIVSRNINDPYKIFRLKKNTGRGFRIISIPDPELMKVQRWINKNILTLGRPNSVSYAFMEGISVKDAAELHCGCRWLIKLDVRQFFETISEIPVYRVFRKFGYQPLVSFELTRLCSRLGSNTKARNKKRWLANKDKYNVINQYKHYRMGHLPQGAPTSPMLSNLVMESFDESILKIANECNLVYTRYADDLAFSTKSNEFTREDAKHFIYQVYDVMKQYGLSPNTSKTKIVPPGSRKIILGLLVDGERPKLTREFRNNLRQHIYYLRNSQIGPAEHARKRGFTSLLGLRHHIEGLISYAAHIDPMLAKKYRLDLKSVEWPF